MNTVIETHGLEKRFGRVRALDGLDLSVDAGEVHGFLGPNGAGKSTTIRVLLGLARASGGSATVFGKNPWKDAVELHKRIAYVPGDASLWPNLSWTPKDHSSPAARRPPSESPSSPSAWSAVAAGDTSARIGDSFAAAAAQLPAALLYLTVLALVFVALPGWTIGLGWTLLGLGTVFGMFGGLVGLPEWIRDLSPFTHSPVPIGTSTDWSGGVWMLCIAIVVAILATMGMKRRELNTA